MKALRVLSALIMLSALIILASYGLFSAIKTVASADAALSVSVSNNVVINVGAPSDLRSEQLDRIVSAVRTK